MIRRLFLVLQAFSLIALAFAIVIAQDGQSSRSNGKSEYIGPAADHHQHVFSPAYTANFFLPVQRPLLLKT